MTAIISDIHANYPALKAVMDDIQRRGGVRKYSPWEMCAVITA